jgi:hypothetical protein
LGHNRARFFPVGGGVFRIDHDQKFQQTTNLRYQWKRSGPWAAFTWRYDSGLIAGDVATIEEALALTANEQAAIGFFCTARTQGPDAQCNASNSGATRVNIPAPGTADPDHNPARLASRHLFDVGVGTDDLIGKQDQAHVTLRFSVSNITNEVALYNFHSTFTGTHFVAPRTYTGAVGFTF